MTNEQILSRELLSYLGTIPQTLKTQGPRFVGELCVCLGNAVLRMAHDLERGQPELYQPLSEHPTSLYALGKQFRELGLELWDKPGDKEVLSLEREIDLLKTRLALIEQKRGAR